MEKLTRLNQERRHELVSHDHQITVQSTHNLTKPYDTTVAVVRRGRTAQIIISQQNQYVK